MDDALKTRWLPACAALLLAASMNLSRASGDAIVITKAMSASTIAEVFVVNDSVRMELEIGAQDIVAFRNLLPEEIYQRFEFENASPYKDRIQQFFARDMTIQVDGKSLTGEVLELTARKRIERDEITGKPLPVQPADAKMVIYAKLNYKLEGQPKSISITPPTDADGKRVIANIGFATYHRGLPVMEFRYLSSEETLDLDWHDAWYSKFRNKNLWRQYDAPLSVFLYVEPFEVRVEVVVRPVDLQRWTELGVTPEQIIPVADQKEIKSRVASFLQEQIAVTIDGKSEEGQFDRIHFLNRSLRKTGVVYPDVDLHGSSATLGVIFVYPVEQLPEDVTMKWALFDEKISAIPAIATDEAGGLPSTISVDDPTLTWKNFLTNPTIPAMVAIQPPPAKPRIALPVVSICLLVLAGFALFGWKSLKTKKRTALAIVAAASVVAAIYCWPVANVTVDNPIAKAKHLSEESAQEVTSSLIHNLYQSFNRSDESVVYDRLANSVSGDLLQEIYLQISRRIQLEDQGGAQVKIDTVEVQSNDVTFPEESGFTSRVEWIVSGTVGHWGHLHTRASQYVANFAIQPLDGVWKITSLQVIDENTLGSAPVDQN